MQRRQALHLLGVGTGISLGGCLSGGSPGDGKTAGRTHTDRDDNSTPLPTPREPAATPPSNTDKIDIELPGEPARIRSGKLPVYEVVDASNSDSKQFSDGLDKGTQNITHTGRSSEITAAPVNNGSGEASGYATGTYRTAWTAPETGKYQLKAVFNRYGEFRYNQPPNGQLMTSFDINAQLVNYDTNTVVANQRFPQSLQSSTPQTTAAVGEFLIETAIASLVGYSLGLGLVARVVLQQVVDELVDLETTSAGGQQYDITTGIPRAASPLNIGGPFEVTEGTTAVFEISPMMSWAYAVNGFRMRPEFSAGFELDRFEVTKLS